MPLFRRMLDQFRLEGEEIVRRSTNKSVAFVPGQGGYGRVWLCTGKRGGTMILYHRLKYALAHGWLPKLVDHKNRTKTDNRLQNLWPATKSENAMNSISKPGRGVTLSHGKWQARVKVAGKYQHLGTYATYEEAVVVADAARLKAHGEFYSDG